MILTSSLAREYSLQGRTHLANTISYNENHLESEYPLCSLKYVEQCKIMCITQELM